MWEPDELSLRSGFSAATSERQALDLVYDLER
jgi:hypothetical protein